MSPPRTLGTLPGGYDKCHRRWSRSPPIALLVLLYGVLALALPICRRPETGGGREDGAVARGMEIYILHADPALTKEWTACPSPNP